MVELGDPGSNYGFIQDIFSLSLHANPTIKLTVLRHDKKAIQHDHDDKTPLNRISVKFYFKKSMNILSLCPFFMHQMMHSTVIKEDGMIRDLMILVASLLCLCITSWNPVPSN